MRETEREREREKELFLPVPKFDPRLKAPPPSSYCLVSEVVDNENVDKPLNRLLLDIFYL